MKDQVSLSSSILPQKETEFNFIKISAADVTKRNVLLKFKLFSDAGDKCHQALLFAKRKKVLKLWCSGDADVYFPLHHQMSVWVDRAVEHGDAGKVTEVLDVIDSREDAKAKLTSCSGNFHVIRMNRE